jgi:DNA-directed RNA polymerase subunit RPC12/RpoP
VILAKRVKKIISLIIVLGIAGLTFVSILPWISITETTLSGEPITTYHDIASMENSNDEQINSLARDTQLLNICFWMLIIFGLLSFIGMMLRASGKYFKMAQIIMFIGCANVIFSILVVILNFRLIQNIESIANVSLAPLFGFSFITIKYAHLVLITGIIALMGSVSYAGLIIFFSIKSYIGQKKQQYDKKTTSKQFSQKMEQKPIAKKSNLEKKKEIARRIQPTEKRFGSEYGASLKTNIRQEYYADRERGKTLEPEKTTTQQPDVPSVTEKIHEDSSDTKKESYGKPFAEEQITKPEITSETAQEKSSEPDKLPTSPLFEKALSSALERIQPELKKEKIEQRQSQEQQPAKKKISVRCSECKNVFTVEKGEFETKIECPHCGRKGVIKQ